MPCETIRSRLGFTLVEVLIVVVVMSVLAGIVVQNFLGITDDADIKIATHNLGVLRGMIETYRGQHGGLLPSASLEELLQTTNAAGHIGNPPTHTLGPYLSDIPGNPLTRSSAITIISTDVPTAAHTSGGGWLYNPASGKIWLDHADMLSQ